MRQAAAVMVRTTAAASILAQRADVPLARFHVVRNGRDERIFTPATASQRAAGRTELGIAGDVPLLAYAGSAGPQYRFDAIAATALALLDRHPGARLLVLSGEPESALASWWQRPRASRPCSPFARWRPRTSRDSAAADAGLAYRATSFSTRAIAPIKLGEYLLCGLPAIGTATVGDTAAAVAAGVFLDEAAGPAAAADWLLLTILPRRDAWRDTARAVGRKHFSLETSVEDYRRAIAAVSELARERTKQLDQPRGL